MGYLHDILEGLDSLATVHEARSTGAKALCSIQYSVHAFAVSSVSLPHKTLELNTQQDSEFHKPIFKSLLNSRIVLFLVQWYSIATGFRDLGPWIPHSWKIP